MTSDVIRVLIVDDIPETRDHLTKLLGFESDMEVVGTAASGEEALDVAPSVRPDVILMDINMPGLDGITTTERLASRVPNASIVMMSVQGEADYLRRAMLAGAREFLVKPFSSDELAASIRQVHRRELEKQGRGAQLPVSGDGESPPTSAREPGKVLTVFSPKGGVGRTTVAVNLAVAAVTELGKRVALVDGSFQFGDIGVMLNLNPKNQSIADLVHELDQGELETLEKVLVTHSSGVRVLLAPPTPERAELILPEHLKKVLDALRATHDLVVVDSWPIFNEISLGLLDQADMILALLTLEITNIKNIRLFLELAEQLGYREKVSLVLNRADSALGIRVADVESSIGRRIDHTVVSDGRSVVYALNRGVPFVITNKQAQVSQDIIRLARAAVGGAEAPAPEATRQQAQQRFQIFARR